MEFLLPDIGEGVAEGEIVKWYVAPGATVREEQDFVEVMTDKATVMIPCPVSGTLGELLAREGDVVPVHSPIARFTQVTSGRLAGAHGQAGHTAGAPAAQAASGAAAHAVAGHAGGGNGAGHAGGGGAATALLEAPVGRVLATPATRRHARTVGVDIRRVRGTGPSGRVTRADVDRAAGGGHSGAAPTPVAAARSAAPAAPRAAAPAPVAPARATAPAAPVAPPAPRPLLGVEAEDERIPLRGVRRKIAEQMARSKRTAAHYTYVEEVDVTDLLALRERMKPVAAERGARITVTTFIVKAVARALERHPQLNAHMDDERGELVRKGARNVGIAVDAPQGLLVPVIKHADRRSMLDIALELGRLGEGARQGTLAPADLQGGTFTITNAGQIGGLLATPILNYPEVAILGVHKTKTRPVWRGGQFVPREVMYLSISLDHRAVDGADAARFMNDVVRYLEDPQLFILEGV